MDDYCFMDPNLMDFKADTLRKAIVKLHRLNAACHTSPDDWALNMLEATKDLTDPEAQEKFYIYLANPSGFEENNELWNALEKFDRDNTEQKIVTECTPDPWDDSMFTQKERTIGHTKYIYVENKHWTPPEEDEPLGTLSEVSDESDDEKIQTPDLD